MKCGWRNYIMAADPLGKKVCHEILGKLRQAEDEVNMYLPEFRRICLWLAAAAATVLLPARGSLSQNPERLAQAAAGEYQLELYTAIKKPFGLEGKERLFSFTSAEELNAWTSSVAFGPWGNSHGNPLTKDEYVLGFLVRNSQGEIPSDSYQIASAYRATMEGGQVESVWPRAGTGNPLTEVNGYKWRYQLAPMVISVTKGAERIEKLEGALVLIPRDRTVIALAKEDTAAYARQVTVFALGVQQTSRGLTYTFVVCRSEQGKAAASKANPKAKPVDSVDIDFTGKTAEGKRVSSNSKLRIQLNESAKKKLISEFVSKTRAQPQVSAVEEAMMAVLKDPKAEFSVLQVGFSNQRADLEEVEVAINVMTGNPQLIPFEISNIALPTPADADAVNEFVAKQPVAQPPAIESPLEFRTCRDATGSFSVEAKLLGMEGQAVQLGKKNGDVIKVPITKLSQADQDYLSTINQ